MHFRTLSHFLRREFRGGGITVILFLVSVLLAAHSIGFIRSLQRSFESIIAQQRQLLLGADIAISSTSPLTDDAESALNEFLKSSNAEHDVVIGFTTMARKVASGEGRLAQVRAITERFPLYGNVVTEPKAAFDEFRQGNGVLVEETLMLQLELSPGDQLQIGEGRFAVVGTLRSVPGEVAGLALLAPRIYLPSANLPETQLIQFGSQVRYRRLLKTPQEPAPESLQSLRTSLEAHGVRLETAADREESIGKTLDRVFGFFNLAGALTFLIGGVAVAHSTLLFIRSKTRTLAILRALGCSAQDASRLLLLEVTLLAGISAVLGGFAGGLLQYVLQDLPVPEPWRSLLRSGTPLEFSWLGSLEGALLSLFSTLLIALPELLRIKRQGISQLFRGEHDAVLSHEGASKGQGNYEQGKVFAVLVLVASIVTWLTTGRLFYAIGILVGSCLLVLALSLSIAGLQSASRELSRYVRSFPIRYAIASFYRPHPTMRASLFVFVFIGFFLTLIAFVKTSLEAELSKSQLNASNTLVLFDIQPNQRQELQEELTRRDVNHAAATPIVTMRLVAVQGERVRSGSLPLRDPLKEIPSWTLRREYRSTYRDYVESSEVVVAGSWPFPESKVAESQVTETQAEQVPISIEEGLAKKLRIGLGAKLIFDVQGVELETTVQAIRRVNWRQIATNFFVVFPAKVLEDAPQTFALSLSPASNTAKSELLRSLGQKFPNISSIDLTFILEAIDRLFEQLLRLVNLMVASIFVLSLILFATAAYFRQQMRTRERGILAALGAPPRMHDRLVLAEYAVIGAFISLVSLLTATVGAIILTRFVLDYPFAVPIRMVLFMLFALIILLPASAWIIARLSPEIRTSLRNE